MLNLMSVAVEGADRVRVERATESVRRQGFLPATNFEWEGGALTAWSHPSGQAADHGEVRTPAGVACCAGPIWYRGNFGRIALIAILDDIDGAGHIDESQVRGNYALFIRTDRCCLLMNDALGFVRIHASADRRFYSTSWLASCAYAGPVEIDEASAIEYVLLGAPHSDASVARGITTLQLGGAYDLARRSIQARLNPNDWCSLPVLPSFDEAVEQIAHYLKAASYEVASAFPGRVRAALSGGFDSRLIVASLLACGNRPQLFVYGSSDSSDVPVAREAARGVGLPLQHIDKQALRRGLSEPDLGSLVENALFFDGLPNDGIHDAGIDRLTRLAQTASGGIALNGGGGEIFRNYFHLPDHPFHAMDVVQAFYRGFSKKVFRRAGVLGAYCDRLVASIERSLGLGQGRSDRRFTRGQVELLYPLFRCHFWMGLNNSIATRHGYYMTPLIDLNTVQLTWNLPLGWKNAGRLESRLIAALHAELANQPSSYGFRFTDGPDWRARFSDWSTRMRPVRARPVINALHRHLADAAVPMALAERCRSLLPGEWRLDPILDLAKLPDAGAFARALAIEVVWRELID
jgi:asparagine synthase (glutamine-hydrolysing)